MYRLASPFVGYPFRVFIGGRRMYRMDRDTKCNSQIILVNLIAWTTFLLWEITIKIRSPEANIRVDMLIIAPILIILSAISGKKPKNR